MSPIAIEHSNADANGIPHEDVSIVSFEIKGELLFWTLQTQMADSFGVRSEISDKS